MRDTGKGRLDLSSIREKLRSSRGEDYWRSLGELAETQEFQEFFHNEFPGLSVQRSECIDRRDLLKLMGASLALAGLSGCTSAPAEKIVPYVRTPEQFVPGKPLYYATAMPLAGYATGILVESHLGRPTKIEGNPRHPASLGAAGAFAQASVLSLYDPDRSQAMVRNGRISSWISFLAAVNEMREAQHLKKGAGLRILTETVTSPTLYAQIQALLAEFPAAKWHQHEPAGGDNVRAGAQLAFGEHVNTYYQVDKADVIVALDSDFLTFGPASLRYAREWAARREPRNGGRGMSRMYSVESTPTATGAVSDHRLALRALEIENLARALAKGIGVQIEAAEMPSPHAEWIAAVARDLKAHRGSSLIVAGECQSASLHALAHVINHLLDATGKTVVYTDPVEARPVDQARSLLELVEDMKAGRVDALIMLGGNPVFTAPADYEFAQHLSKVKMSVHLSLYDDETSKLCAWQVPEAHYLEAWSDSRAFDGTITIMQPLIAPLYQGKSAHELLSTLSGKSGVTGHDTVRDFWKARTKATDFDEFWQVSLHEGLVANSALPPKPATLRPDRAARLAAPGVPPSAPGLEIVFRPDPTIFDGRFANNGWLQELPKPLTKLTWDNAALISPYTAERLGLRSGDMVELEYRGRSLRAPVWILPGHAPDSVTAHLGYGRSEAGRLGSGAGFNAYAVRVSSNPWFGLGVELRRTAGSATLACTQDHQGIDALKQASREAGRRNLLRVGTVAEFEKDPNFVREMGEEPAPELTLYPGYDYSSGYAWGMSINLNSCIGCNACVVACQSENNIPVVGKTEVTRGREMHWIRIDRYYKGELDHPEAYFQPVLCMHCENAPCEVVCPVAATVHSSEGLNQMVYNRCVGTRYCSNNCPYKVRRFNFFQYSDWDTPSLKPLRNPDVTVRARGVMEKCTYCIQRINAAKIEAEKEDRPVRDGEVVTACQAACPTNAIVFGDINDRSSQVARLKTQPLSYGMLAELNTRPRTSYLAKLKNPNPELERE